eukprot:7113879-Alexandrium_andersonii.AAC.1
MKQCNERGEAYKAIDKVIDTDVEANNAIDRLFRDVEADKAIDKMIGPEAAADPEVRKVADAYSVLA